MIILMIKKILLIILLIVIILFYILLKYIGKHYCGYENFYKILKQLKGNENENEKFMNFGYWTDLTFNLSEASKRLCSRVLNQDDILDNENILDIGCGYADQDFYLLENINDKVKIECIDINENQVKEIKKRINEKGYNKKMNVNIGDATKLNYPNESFDKVISLETAFHYNPRIDFFKETYRVLKNKGCLLICDILVKDNVKYNLLNLPLIITKNYIDIPVENFITKDEWKRQLEEIGFNVEIQDITENTIIPFMDYFERNHGIENFILKKYITFIKYYTIKYNPFIYVVAKVTKNR